MARKALLIWCAGSVLACGSAALATTSLWLAPAKPVAIAVPSDGRLALPDIPEPGPLAGLDAPAPIDGFLPLASISFFADAPGGPRVLRDTLADVPIPPVEPEPGFAEVGLDSAGRDHRLAVRPPPRPSFLLARLDPGAKAPIDEVRPASPAPGFETPAAPQSSIPSWSDVLRNFAPQTSKPERVIHAGIASWYGPGFHGRKTASGERFDQNDMTAAHRTLPFGSRVKVVEERSGRSIVVRINDRGPFKHGRVIDLSKAAAQALGVGGLSRVKVVSAD